MITWKQAPEVDYERRERQRQAASQFTPDVPWGHQPRENRHHRRRGAKGQVRVRDLIRRLAGEAALTLMLTAVLTIPAFAAVVLSAPAKADPVDSYTAHYAGTICLALDERPELDTITRLMDGMVVDGYGAFRGRIMLDSVSGWCPAHSGLLDEYVAVYLPKNTERTLV